MNVSSSSSLVGSRRAGPSGPASSFWTGRQQIDFREDVPSENEHRIARGEQRLPDQFEVVGGVLDAEDLMRAIDSPAVLACLNDRCRRGRGCARRLSRRHAHAVDLGRSERLINQASVSGMLTIKIAPTTVAGEGLRSTIVNW